MFTVDLARELEPSGTTVNALHPATYMNTTMVRAAGTTPMSTIEQGGDAMLRLATVADVSKKAGVSSTEYRRRRRTVRRRTTAPVGGCGRSVSNWWDLVRVCLRALEGNCSGCSEVALERTSRNRFVPSRRSRANRRICLGSARHLRHVSSGRGDVRHPWPRHAKPMRRTVL
jgi:hypothetical protein